MHDPVSSRRSPSTERLGRAARPHRRRSIGLLTVAMVAVVAVFSAGCATFVAIPGVAGCNITPSTSFWRANVTGLPVHTSSGTWVATIGATRSLKADFGSGLYLGQPIGIPYDVVPGTQAKVNVTFDYADESDAVGYPIPANPHVEGGASATGDRHILIVDKDNCRLYELWNAHPGPNGWSAGVRAGSGATWDMRANAMRTAGFTSSDAAGLQVLPGLVRYEEVAAGKVLHAIRMTVPATAGSYVWPASHKAGSGGAAYPPMGTWLRLKSTVNEASFDPAVRPIIVALKTYGGVIADNGSAWYMSGVPDPRWDNSKLATLGSIKGSDFEVVNAASEKVANNSYQAQTAQ